MAVRYITRRKQSYWLIDIRDPRLPARIRKRAQSSTRRGAEDEEAEILHNALHPPAEPWTLARFWVERYEPLILPQKKPATRLSYVSVWRRPGGVRESLGDCDIATLPPDKVAAMATRLVKSGRTAKAHVVLLKSMLGHAVELGCIKDPPRLPKRLYRTPKKLRDAPSAEEMRRCIDAARGWIRRALVLAVYCGLRQGEVRALRVRDIDFRTGFIYVRQAFSENEETVTKGYAEREVPIPPEANLFLRSITKGLRPDAFLVLTSRGKTPRRQAVLTAYKAIRRRLGLPPKAYHLTRHFNASHLGALGTDAETIRDIEGHANLSTTMSYLHTTRERKTGAAARLQLGTKLDTPDEGVALYAVK